MEEKDKLMLETLRFILVEVVGTDPKFREFEEYQDLIGRFEELLNPRKSDHQEIKETLKETTNTDKKKIKKLNADFRREKK